MGVNLLNHKLQQMLIFTNQFKLFEFVNFVFLINEHH